MSIQAESQLSVGATASKRLPGIQVLRAVAALAVVVLHAQMVAERFSLMPPFISAAVGHFGKYGVDLFFVISGFVITQTILLHAPSAGAFFVRRAWRIVPLYALLTLLAFGIRMLTPAAWFVSPAPDIADLLLSITFLSGHNPIIGAGWTLEFEMFFYACAALALGLAAKTPRVHWSSLAYALAALAVIGQFIPWIPSPLATLLDPLLIEFVLGMIVAEFHVTRRLPAKKLVAALVAIASTWPDSGAVLWPGICSALLVLAAVRIGTATAAIWPVRLFAVLGDASYSIYLLQFFTLPLVGRMMFQAFDGRYPNVTLAAAVAATLVAGWLCYRYIEQPILRWRPAHP